MPSSPSHDNPPPPNSITALYQALVGPLGQPYYLARFTRFDDIGRSFPTWNWAASLLTLNWLLFRGLWGPALGYAGALVGAALGVFGLGKLVLGFSDDSLHALLGVGLAIAFVVPGMYGNAWYHRRSKRQMADAILTTDDNDQAARKLAGLAPSPRRLGLLALGNAVVLAPVVAWWALSWQLTGMGRVAGGAQPAASAPLVAGAPVRAASAASAPGAPASAASPAPMAVATATANPPGPVASRVGGGSIASAHEPAGSDAAAGRLMSSGSAPAAPPVAGASAVAASAAASRAVATVAPAAVASAAAKPVDPKPASASATPSGRAMAASSTTPAPPSATGNATATVKARTPAIPAPKARQFFVDAGIYAQTGNAKRAIDSLREARLPVLSEELDMVRGTRTRVRVGPFSNRAQAEQAARQVKALGLPALVEPAR